MAGTIHLKMATIVYKMGLPETENEAPPRELGRLHGLEPREEVDVAAVEVVSAVPLQARPAQPTARGRPKATNWCHPDCRQLATKRHTRPTSAKCDTCVAFEPPCTHSCRSLPPASSCVVDEWRILTDPLAQRPFQLHQQLLHLPWPWLGKVTAQVKFYGRDVPGPRPPDDRGG